MGANDSKSDSKKSFWTTLPGILAGITGIVTAITGLILALNAAGIIGRASGQTATPIPGLVETVQAVLQGTKIAEAVNGTQTEIAVKQLGPPTSTPTPTLTDTPTIVPTNTPTSIPDFRATMDAQATQDTRETQIAQAVLATLDALATVNAQVALDVPTNTPEPTSTGVAFASLGFTGNPVTNNSQWTPISQSFNGVEMVLVPVGCFMMGSEDGEEDERPVHQQCVSAPFWIDRFDVTNEQFEQFSGLAANPGDWPNPNQPRTSVTWSEARDFCDQRDGNIYDPQGNGVRLPTEAEWEYAARGPDSLVYPWGNEFVLENVVWDENLPEPADVGSRPAGASWVDALDMSGNVWQWVSSAYMDYPYNPDDGREDLSRMDIQRVLRGGSFDFGVFGLRAANRAWFNPDIVFNFFGFRCALSQ